MGQHSTDDGDEKAAVTCNLLDGTAETTVSDHQQAMLLEEQLDQFSIAFRDCEMEVEFFDAVTEKTADATKLTMLDGAATVYAADTETAEDIVERGGEWTTEIEGYEVRFRFSETGWVDWGAESGRTE